MGKKKRNRKIVAVKPKEVYYSVDFTKDELMYLSLAITEYQKNHMVRAWDMERGATQRQERIVTVSERVGRIIETRLLELLRE